MHTEEKKQLKAKSSEELKKLINEEVDKLRVLRFDFAAGKIKNVSEIWKAKKRIAVALTYLEQKKRASVDKLKVL
ncbi:MAG TPA: 50S ribosomal protein L29 [Candidatus Paceibacterota bacterium]